MLAIPAGQFELGTGRKLRVNTEVPAELTPVAIRIERPFALGRFEVTRREYRAFVLATHRTTRAKCRTWVDSRQGFADLTIAWDEPNVPARPTDRHPATCVDWHDAAAYAAWLAQKTGKPYRLPSEVEWEYAAKAGTRTLRPWGNDPNQGCEHANSFDLDAAARRALAWKPAACRDGFSDIAPVGSLKPNRFGLHDMIGNVWEWIADCSTLTYVGRPTDQRAWVWDGGCKRRIQRGGGWITAPDRSRSSFHGDGDDEDRADFAGFRVARDLP
jgi:formylglycine-generating enzyme required for sulfatase activity